MNMVIHVLMDAAVRMCHYRGLLLRRLIFPFCLFAFSAVMINLGFAFYWMDFAQSAGQVERSFRGQ